MRAILAWSWVGVVLTGTLLVVDGWNDALLGMAPVLFTVLGAVIATRQPQNRIAWLFLAVGIFVVVPVLQLRLSDEPPNPVEPLDVLAAGGENFSYFGLILLLALLLFLFPTGRFLTRRWRWAGWVGAFSLVGFTSTGLFSLEVSGGSSGASWIVPNPYGFIPETLVEILITVAGVSMVLLLVIGFIAIVVRYRRSDAVVRAQIKWVALALISVVISILYQLFTNGQGVLSGLLFKLSFLSLPVSIGMAILRYKLFEIDRIISRTVGYTIVVGLLAFAYAVGAVWLPSRMTGGQSPVFVAASTLGVAALFNPVRRRVIHAVDHRFYRSRYDAERVLERFGDRLKDQIDIEQIAEDSISVIRDTMQPSSVGVWIRG